MNEVRIIGIKYPPEYFEYTKKNFPMPDDDALPENCRWDFAEGVQDCNHYLLAIVCTNLDGKTCLSIDQLPFSIFMENPKIWWNLAREILNAFTRPVMYAADIEAKMSGVFYEGFASHKYDYDE